MPEELRKQWPRCPRLPATLLGRLARDERFPGAGSLLLMDARARALGQSAQIASLAVVADARDDAARQHPGHRDRRTTSADHVDQKKRIEVSWSGTRPESSKGSTERKAVD